MPHPPPPGVLMLSTSPDSTSIVSLPDSFISSYPDLKRTFSPKCACSPPWAPGGGNLRLSDSKVTRAGLRNSTSRIRPSPPLYFPEPPEPRLIAYFFSRRGNANSRAYTGVFIVLVMWVCIPEIPSLLGRAPIPPAMVS